MADGRRGTDALLVTADGTAPDGVHHDAVAEGAVTGGASPGQGDPAGRSVEDDDLLDDGDVVGARRGRTALVTAVAVGVVLAVLIAILATGDPSDLTDSPLLGQRAPALAGASLLSGEDFDLADERGRWVVVNFFATWCEPCRAEHPDLVRFAAAHEQTDDARVVSVVFSDEASDVERFFAERGGEWAVVDDTTGIVPSWGVTGVPESYLVDPAGVVVSKIVGGITTEGLEELLGRAQAGPGAS